MYNIFNYQIFFVLFITMKKIGEIFFKASAVATIITALVGCPVLGIIATILLVLSGILIIWP